MATNPFATPTVDPDCRVASKRRSVAGASITNAYSAKRRRVSLASVDLSRELQPRFGHDHEPEVEATVADRFIPARPKTTLPLQSTPRTSRIARVFGLADDRILNFADTPLSTPDAKVVRLLRKSASELFKTPSITPPTSAAANVAPNKQHILALDGPGIPVHSYASPLSWSLKNYIAVACGKEVYHQNLDTRLVSKLCHLSGSPHDTLHGIEWAKSQPDLLALATIHGGVEVWDTVKSKQVVNRPVIQWVGMGGMSWHDMTLAVGRADGSIAVFDIRANRIIASIAGHKGNVLGVQWNHDGTYMASGDRHGSVLIWDARATKALRSGSKILRMKHDGPVKALSWCPWKPELLATGSNFPEGKIRIWNATSLSSPPEPLHILPVNNTSVTSLHWSPHCKEILSTHGSSWKPPTSRSLPTRLQHVSGPLVNSVAVHSYPACQKITSIVAHAGAVGHSCLSPDGTKLFTVCPAEEAMKMWRVWGYRKELEKPDSVFDKCAIR